MNCQCVLNRYYLFHKDTLLVILLKEICQIGLQSIYLRLKMFNVTRIFFVVVT